MIYLACPYWHEHHLIRDYRVAQAECAAALLSEAGELVYSPISHSQGIKKGAEVLGLEIRHTDQHDYWMRHSIEMLGSCSRIIVLCLDGWRESKGVTEEVAFAKEESIPLTYAAIDRSDTELGDVTRLLTATMPFDPDGNIEGPHSYMPLGKDGSAPPIFNTPVNTLRLQDIANEVARWQSYNFEQSGGSAAFKGLVEEFGELVEKLAEDNIGEYLAPQEMATLLRVQAALGRIAHSNLKAEQNIREDQSHRASEIDAIGDMLIYLIDYCNQRDIDIAAALCDTWSSVRERDWIKFPINGRTE